MAYPKKSSSDVLSKEDYEKEKDAKMADFLKQRSDAIIASLNSTPENVPIWESPIFHNKYINPVSNVRYNSGNASSLSAQIQIREMNKEPDAENNNEGTLPFFMTYAQAKKMDYKLKKVVKHI